MRSPALAAFTAALVTVGLLGVLAMFAGSAADASERFVLKYACYAPEGSTYVRAMRAWDAELRERSGDRLSFRIYPGGIQGDERDMVRKVRVGQLHMVGMTGIGLGEVLPAIRILEMPAYYRDYAEVDAATAAIEAPLEGLLRTAGYELLGWGEAGTVHIFSSKPIRTLDELASTRMWAWEGDQISAELFKVFNIKPVPLTLPDVLPSLQTGMIDGVYGSPLAVVALQWTSHVKYMTEQSLGRAMGGTVLDASRFAALPPDLQVLLKETGRKYHAQLVTGTRDDNARSIETLKRQGVEAIQISPAEWNRLKEGAAQVRANLTGTMWSQELLDQVEASVIKTRAGSPEKARPATPSTGSLLTGGHQGAAP